MTRGGGRGGLEKDKKRGGAPTSFEDRVRDADSWFEKTLDDLENKSVEAKEGIKVVPDREFGDAATAKGRLPFIPAPTTFLDGLAAQKAKELKGEDKKRGGGHSNFDLKKLKSKTKDGLANAASAAGISKDVLHYAVNSLPQLSKAEEDDKRTVFWRIMEDHCRRIDRTDLETIKGLLKKPTEDSAFKIPAVGKKYKTQWQDEERIKAQLDRMYHTENSFPPSSSNQGSKSGAGAAAKPAATVSPLVKNRSKSSTPAPQSRPGSSLGGRRGSAQLITNAICPKVPPLSQEAMSELCDVCFGGDSQEGNMIVFCDNCNVAVHQACYGIPVVPEGQWLCNKCREIKSNGGGATNPKAKAQGPRCVLCPVRHGAMKPCDPKTAVTSAGEPSKKQEFVHLFCSQWIPETFIKAEDTTRMEPVQNLSGISKDRFKLLCSICKQRHGACVQCSHGLCATAFHPLCARATGLRMEVVGSEGSDDVDLKVYCQKHSRRPVKRSILDAARTQQPQQQPKTPPPPATDQSKTKEHHPSTQTPKGKDRDRSAGGGAQSTSAPPKSKDLLGELRPKEIAAALRQMSALFGLKLSEISTQMGMSQERLNGLLYKKAALTDEDKKKAVAFIRKYTADNLQSKLFSAEEEEEERRKQPGPPSQGEDPPSAKTPPPGASEADKPKTTTTATAADASAKGPNAQDKGSDVKNGSMFRGILPKVFRTEVGEYMHLYTKLMLKTMADLDAPAPALPMGTEEERTYALACLPESETLAELFMMQHELAKQMLVNRANLRSLATKVSEKVPEEASYFEDRDKDLQKVRKFIEASKEAKRLLKREKRAEQQKQNLAAAEAAVAQSTRYSAGRGNGSEDFAKPEDAQAPPQPPPPVSVYTKDEAGNDVIYDKYSEQKTDQDLLCSVCGQAHSEEPNQILFCDMCDLAVHQRCYGISKIPEGEWLCWPCREHEQECLRKGMPKTQIRKPRWQGGDFTAVDATKCALCPVKRGAFKKSKDGEWCHVVCAMWNKIPIEDEDTIDSIGSVKDALLGTKNMACTLCNQQTGALVKCNYGHCQTFFHPLCGRAAGFAMPLRSGIGTSALVRIYCGRHQHLVQHHPSSPTKAGGAAPMGPMPPTLLDHIKWLDANLKRLRQIRQELERLRLISDVLVKREKTKASLLKAEQDYVVRCLQRPKAAKEFEEKMQNKEFAEKVVASRGGPELGGGGLKRKGWFQSYGGAKYARTQGSSMGQPMVERQRIMTVNEAKATNVKLPPGYLYVPLDIPAQAYGGENGDGAAGGEAGKKK